MFILLLILKKNKDSGPKCQWSEKETGHICILKELQRLALHGLAKSTRDELKKKIKIAIRFLTPRQIKVTKERGKNGLENIEI